MIAKSGLQMAAGKTSAKDVEDGSISRHLLIKSTAFQSSCSHSTVPSAGNDVLLPNTSSSPDLLRRRSGPTSETSHMGVELWGRPRTAANTPHASTDVEVIQRLVQARWENYST